jgi:hypothetical protein
MLTATLLYFFYLFTWIGWSAWRTTLAFAALSEHKFGGFVPPPL